MPHVDFESSAAMPAGTYGAKVENCVENAGKSNVEITWKITEDPSAAHLGETVTDYLSWKNQGSAKRMKLILRRLGFNPPDVGGFDFSASELIGRTAVIEVVHEDYNGETRARIPYAGVHQGVKPGGPGATLGGAGAGQPGATAGGGAAASGTPAAKGVDTPF